MAQANFIGHCIDKDDDFRAEPGSKTVLCEICSRQISFKPSHIQKINQHIAQGDSIRYLCNDCGTVAYIVEEVLNLADTKYLAMEISRNGNITHRSGIENN